MTPPRRAVRITVRSTVRPIVAFNSLLAVLALAVAPAAHGDDAAPSRPNFVVILTDDLGWGDLASQGHPHIRTPNLDLMAEQGLRFTSCYSAAPVCSPARVGLLTGRSPNRAGVFDWIPSVDQANMAGRQSRHLVHLRAEEITLPQLLRQAGYATAMAGKWHCNAAFNDPRQPQPGDAGFDHWFATQNNAAPSHENPVNFVRNGEPVGEVEGYSCRIVTDEGIAWLERHLEADAEQPFFLYLAYHEPHEPVASPPELVAGYLDVADNEDEAQYFANVENLDAAVGDLLDALDRLGLADDTLVFFTSDNGPETLGRYRGASRSYGSPGPLRGMKLWTTEAGVRVPGILRWPARVEGGRVIDDPVSALDLLPTFSGLAGVETPDGLALDGGDLTQLLTGEGPAPGRSLFWFFYDAINEQRAALRSGPWKLLASLESGDEPLPRLSNITEANAGLVRDARLTNFSLYRLTEDIGEAEDVSGAYPEVLQRLSRELESLHRELAGSMHFWPDKPLPDDPR